MNAPADTSQAAAPGAEPMREPIVCTVAGPRVPYSSQTYTGAELRHTSPRRGAYDAFAMPSLFNGKRTPPPASTRPMNFVHTSGRVDFLETKAAERRFSIAEATSTDTVYLPRPESAPGLVLAYLKEHGGHLTYNDLKDRFGIPQSSVTAVFKRALDNGVFVRIVVAHRSAFALPGYVPPGEQHTPAPRPPKELAALLRRLAKRRAEVEQLEAAIADLQKQERLRALITK